MITISRLSALVVFESMFGNTAIVARAVAGGLTLEGVDVTLTDVSQAPLLDVVVQGLIVVGAPTHAFALSRPATRAEAVRQGASPAIAETGVREWLIAGRHPVNEERLAATFDTRVTKVRRLPKAASTRGARMLVRAGFRMVAQPAGFLVEGIEGPPVDGELERARAWGRHLAITSQSRLVRA